MISVVIPVHNEARGLVETLNSIARGRTTSRPAEFVLSDDVSKDGSCRSLPGAIDGMPIRVVRSSSRLGVAKARNLAARAANGSTLFITDAHVRVSHGWDEVVSNDGEHILTGAIYDATSGFRAFGCDLVVPYMGTYWRTELIKAPAAVPIASSAATVIPRAIFEKLGGYDEGMRIYGAAEPEFSVRAWLAGIEIVCVPSLEITHTFKGTAQRERFLSQMRSNMMHNSMRFGLCYLNDCMSMQMVRHFSMKYPRQFPKAFKLLVGSDVWQRRRDLQLALPRRFDWFVRRFELRDQIGRPL